MLVNKKNSSRFSKIKLIGRDGDLVGNMDISNALNVAEKKSLDLVLVNNSDKVPVCKLMDYGKYCYEKGKEAQRKNKKPPKEKEFHIRPSTQKHDVDIVLRKCISHIEKKNHINFYIDIPPRESGMKEKIKNKMDYVVEKMSEVSKVDKKNKTHRSIMMHFVPKAEV